MGQNGRKIADHCKIDEHRIDQMFASMRWPVDVLCIWSLMLAMEKWEEDNVHVAYDALIQQGQGQSLRIQQGQWFYS